MASNMSIVFGGRPHERAVHQARPSLVTRTDDFAGPPWPSAAQEALLRAALATDGSAGAHFRRWLAMVDFEGRIDEASYRLLSPVWCRLRADEDDHPLMPRLKGVFRNTWVQAARRSALAAELLQSLRAEGIPTLVTKGLPLSLRYYEDPALRPMNDIDIAVPYAAVPAAGRLLETKGFHTARGSWNSERAVRHAASYNRADGGEIDLHWHILFDCPSHAADSHFWDAARPIRIKGVETLQPCATDLLLQVIVHGVRWNAFTPIRWIADAAAVLGSDEVIDWDRLLGFAQRHRLTRRTLLGLTYLKQRFDLAIPAYALDKLAERATLLERAEVIVMRGEATRPSWRHVRRGLHIVRLLGSDDVGRLPGALAQEMVKRYRKGRSSS
jgi:hypothetical protein